MRIRSATLALVIILISLHLSAEAKALKDNTQTAVTESSGSKPGFDGPAELPRVYIKSSLSDTPAKGHTIAVKDEVGLKEALTRAECGDTISLQAGVTFAGTFRFPAKKCDDSHWIVIRTSALDSALPPEGTRLTPCYAGVPSLPGRPDFHCHGTANVVAKIVFNNKGAGPILLEDGANHYRFIGLEITRDSPGQLIYALISPFHQGASDHIVVDRVWLHGVAHDETARGIALGGSTYFAIVDSFFTDFHCTAVSGACVDSQAISGGYGKYITGPYKIVNNFLEAAAECVLFGGGSAAFVPSDIEIRRNYLFRPLNWMPGHPQFIGATDGHPFIVKNLFELKTGQRVLVDGNIMENAWGGFSQRGFGILLTPKNQASKEGSICPICAVNDVTIRNTRISHVGSGFQVGNGSSSTNGAPKDGGRYSIHDVVVDDIQGDALKGSGVFAQISSAPGIPGVPPLHDVLIDHIDAFPPTAFIIIGGSRAEQRMPRVSITNSIFSAGSGQPLVTTGGGPERNCSALLGRKAIAEVFDDCFLSYGFHHNLLIGGSGDWPKGNAVVKKSADVGFVDFRDGVGGNYRLSASSKFKRVGSDGKDMGADIDAIEKATDGVK